LAAPQVEHVSPVAETTQERPVVHAVPPAQHAWSAPPHGLQVPPPPSTSPVQAKFAWQVPPGQHAWSAPPQFSQVLLFGPGGLLQPSPALHTLLLQHGVPKVPQLTHALTVPPSAFAVIKHSRGD
jgi:hypothetical protein